jgi:iron complex outermembrane recepter protein
VKVVLPLIAIALTAAAVPTWAEETAKPIHTAQSGSQATDTSADTNQSRPGDGAKEAARSKKSKDAISVEEVVVTATRREESIEKLPEAITAITSEQLDTLNAQSFEDYFRTVPGLVMNSAGSGLNRFDFSLRGISSFNLNSPPTSATVGVYFDEIPVTAVGQQVDPRLVDIERIEVLRGPQGTYFGEDSLGGTIRIITKKPNLGEFLGSAETRFSGTSHGGGNDSESVMANLPLITDKLALRANYFNALDAGFINDVSGSCSADACNVSGLKTKGINPNRASGERGMLLFRPVDRLSILAEAVHTNSLRDNTASYAPKVGDLQIILNGGDNTHEQDNLYNVSVNVDLDAAELVSSSSWGYRDINDAQPHLDLSGMPVVTGVLTGMDSYTQEVRLISAKNAQTRWDYIAGLYFSRQNSLATGYGSAGAGGFGNFYNRSQSKDKAAFGEVGYEITDRLIGRLGVRQQTVDFDNTSVLAAGVRSDAAGSNSPTTGRAVMNYNFTSHSMVYTSISRGFRPGGLNSTLNPRNPTQPIPGINPTYNPDTTTNYEFGWKLSEGKRTLNGAIYHIDWQNIQVVGEASVPGAPTPMQYFHNVGGAKVDGLELEGGLELLPGLQGRMSFALMNPVITKNQALPTDTATSYASSYCDRGCPAREGDQIPFVPKTSGSLTFSYRHALNIGGFSGFASLSEQYLGRRYTGFAPTWTGPSQSDAPCVTGTFGGGPPGPGGGGPGGGGPSNCARAHTGDANPAFRIIQASLLTNVQAGIESAHWRVSLYAENLFNRRDPIVISPSNGDAMGDIWFVNTPRTVGVWVRRTFD